MGMAMNRPRNVMQELGGKLGGAIVTIPRTAFFCFGVAAVLLGGHLAWVLGASETPPAILPPAGEVMEGTVPFRFAVVGDNRGNMSVFEEIFAGMEEDGVSLILHTGDIAKRYNPRAFDWVLHELGEENLSVPFCPVPGNHDVDDGEAQDTKRRYLFYNRAFGPRRYWFSYANALFVAFDDSSKRASTEDLDWLDQTLVQLRDQYEACFVYMHVPPHDPRPGGLYALGGGAKRLMNILKEHRVSALFASHIHSYLEDNVAGVPVYITGGAGAGRVKPIVPHHYLLCAVNQGGSFTVQKRDVDGQANMDYFEYAFRVKFPNSAVALAAVGLLLVGAAFTLRTGLRRPGGTNTPASQEKGSDGCGSER